MTQTSSQWSMLKDALRASIESLEGYRVTHALFTTYSFEPEFFETCIVPLLLPDAGQGLSLHSAVRRLQMEELLRESPIAIDVYFDARVVVPGCPLLPYEMVPVRMKGEFHGKIIFLRLEDARGNVRCVLGAGSANLTKAGWWENIESWFFPPNFNPSRPPAGILPGVTELFKFLETRIRADSATASLRDAFKEARPQRVQHGEPTFALFTPNTPRFTEWLGKQKQVKDAQEHSRLEVVSPYFAQGGHAALVGKLLEATDTDALDLWLPEDSWQAGGPAALIEETCYNELKQVNGLRWCEFRDSDLASSRQAEKTPRFLHAKVIRRPGGFCFMGSVNFSNKAFNANFEAGFLFLDRGEPWLTPLIKPPGRFLKPVEQACHEGIDDSAPELCASFDWKTLELSLHFVSANERRKCTDKVVRLLDAQGADAGQQVTLPAVLRPVNASLSRDLQTNPWIKVVFSNGSIAVVWVQQHALEYRPPPFDLRPDVWRILDMWRGLTSGGTGSQPGNVEHLEVLLKRCSDGGEAPPEGAREQDIFGGMATVHGSFYLLRRRLQEECKRENLARCEYYFSAPRPDSLANLVERIEHPPDGAPVEAVAAWVMLQWVIQICADHKNMASGKALSRRAQVLLDEQLKREPLSKLEPTWLEWAGRMFLSAPGKERRVARHFTSRVVQQ